MQGKGNTACVVACPTHTPSQHTPSQHSPLSHNTYFPTATDDPALSAAQQVVTQVTAFLQARGGRALSAALVEHFQSAVPPEQVPLFKQALKQVAVKHTARGQVFWQLKEEDMFAGALP